MSAAGLIGTILGERYKLVDVIGVGGMGTVYAADHLRLGRRVAVKMLRDEFTGDANQRARFTAEARVMAEIGHEHIVSVLDIGTAPNGALYFVMEHLRGEDLADTLARERLLPWPRVRSIGLQLCLALAASHDKKIIHRDLKPSNVFLAERPDGADYVKILDFGIAKVLAVEGRRVSDPQGLHRVDSRRWQHTVTGEVFGTMAYMSPEHFFGEAVDHRTDVYALGVMLYEMLTGTTPLATENIGNFAEELRYLDPRPPSVAAPGAKIPADVDYLVLRALAKKPEDRFQSMKEMGLALAEAREDASVRPLKPLLAVGDSGSTTMVWHKPAQQAALAGLLRASEARPARWTADRRVWVGVAVVLAAAAAVVARLACAAAATELPAAAERVAEVAEAEEVTAEAPPAATPRAAVPETPVDATAVELPMGPAEAVVVDEAPAEPVARVNLPRCPAVTRGEWTKILDPAATQAARCKQEFGVKANVPVALVIAVDDGRASGSPLPGQAGKVLALARCVREGLAGRVKLPARLLGCKQPRFIHYF